MAQGVGRRLRRYRLPGGNHVKFLDDNATYLGNQLECEFGGNRCFGIVCNMDFILICTYEENGENPELVIYKKIKASTKSKNSRNFIESHSAEQNPRTKQKRVPFYFWTDGFRLRRFHQALMRTGSLW